MSSNRAAMRKRNTDSFTSADARARAWISVCKKI